jgi:hypothetical protein
VVGLQTRVRPLGYGISAQGLQRVLGFGSYETAWAWMHKLRRAMVRPDRELLSGVVEVDETFVGGVNPGSGGGTGDKVPVMVAVERLGSHRLGRVRLQVASKPGTLELVDFAVSVVAPGSTIRTDGARMLRRLADMGYTHEYDTGYNAIDKASVLPAVHRVFSLVKRWLMGTMQGSVSPEHVQAYFDVLLSSLETSATSGGTLDRLWRRSALEVTVTPGTYVRLHGVLGPADDLSSRWSRGMDGCRRALPRGSTGGAVLADARRRRGPFARNGTNLRGSPCALPHVGDDKRNRAVCPDARATGFLCPVVGARALAQAPAGPEPASSSRPEAPQPRSCPLTCNRGRHPRRSGGVRALRCLTGMERDRSS